MKTVIKLIFSTTLQDNTIADTLIWRANIDVNTSSEPFMPAWPIELFRQGEGSKVPFIMGTNRDEGVLRLMTGGKITNKLCTSGAELVKLLTTKTINKGRL